MADLELYLFWATLPCLAGEKQIRMAFTSRKKRPLARPQAVRDAHLIVIATEGEKSEVIYFNAFGNSRLKVVTVPCLDGKSSPEAVLENLAKYEQDYELIAEDELWMIIGRDRWPKRALYKVKLLCENSRFGLAISNPCFEVWLAFHFSAEMPERITPRALAAHLRSLGFPYQKNKYNAEELIARVNQAIARAENADVDPKSPWPEPFGSRVYRLVRSILIFHPEISIL